MFLLKCQGPNAHHRFGRATGIRAAGLRSHILAQAVEVVLADLNFLIIYLSSVVLAQKWKILHAS
jgi:hypothetical protein